MSTGSQPAVVTVHADPNTPEAIEFFRWLGMCVGGWAFVDRRMYQIFHHAIDLQQKQSAFIYYRNRAFNNRLRIVDDALKMFLPREQFDGEWKPLRERIEGLSHTRNIFTHHPPMRSLRARDKTPYPIYTIHIEPYERVLNNDYPGLGGKTELEIEDLKQHDADLSALQDTLHNFAWRMGAENAARKTRSASVSLSPKDTSGK